MKTDFYNYLLPAIIITVIVFATGGVLSNYQKQKNESLIREFMASVMFTNGLPETTNQPVEYFRVSPIPDNGDYAVANADKTIVSLKDKNGNVIWSVKVGRYVESFCPEYECRIYSMSFATNQLWGGWNAITNQFLIKVGKSSLGLARQTGRIQYFGSF